jgi:hypothetical protein
MANCCGVFTATATKQPSRDWWNDMRHWCWVSALENAGDRATPALRRVLAKAPNLETRQRLERLLQKLDAYPTSEGEALRAVRAIEVLEYLGTREARAVLQGIVNGSAEARRTQEAKAALRRLQSRDRE